MGLTGYYRRFIKNYGKIAQPLNMLCKSSGSLKWTLKAEEAFVQLKKAMTEAPLLALPDFSQDFVIETDASGNGIGAVLMQQGHPIAYISKANIRLCQPMTKRCLQYCLLLGSGITFWWDGISLSRLITSRSSTCWSKE